MTFKPAIRTESDIDAIVFSPNFQGGHVRRRNAKNTMIAWTNELVNAQINSLRWQARHARKVLQVREQNLAPLFALITRLELKLID